MRRIIILSDEIVLDEKAAKKFLTKDAAAPIQSSDRETAALSEFTEAAIEQAFTNTLEEHGLQMGKLAQPVRVAFTGATVSPGIHDVIAVLGKERTIRAAAKGIANTSSQLDSSS